MPGGLAVCPQSVDPLLALQHAVLALGTMGGSSAVPQDGWTPADDDRMARAQHGSGAAVSLPCPPGSQRMMLFGQSVSVPLPAAGVRHCFWF
jgi:hypothetical protein